MKFGLFDINQPPCLNPRVFASVARQAEAAGLDSLWCGEHVVLPDPRVAPSPMQPTDPILDPVVALTFAAALTSTIRLGTGVIILPQRNPLVLAKELASLDVLSGGRLIFGMGVGYLEPEFTALGVSLKDHGPRSDEYLGAMRAIWSEPRAAFSGRFVSFSGVDAYPKPIQRPMPELVVGGHTPAAYRRSVQQADGWYGFGLDLERTERALQGLREAAQQYERPSTLAALEVSVTPAGPIDRDMAERYAALGVHRLILRPPRGRDATAVETFVAHMGDTLVGQV
jgi:probable F420-dependent oxidoreductase